MDLATFDSCIHDGNGDARIVADLSTAASVGARATPSFMVIPLTGQPAVFSGVRPLEVFERLIESARR